MRDLSSTLEKKLASKIQAGDSSLNASLWVSRPTIPLTDSAFLETQNLPVSARPTKASIAVCRPHTMQDATAVYIGYVESGKAKVIKSVYNHRMNQHTWLDTGFSETAEDISVCFDGTFNKVLSGKVEFVTEDDPWIFTVSSGTLYAQNLTNGVKTILAETNCSAVSSVRATWSEVNRFNYGLVVFFILEGKLYYRQLIDGVWYDAEIVTYGSNTPWSDVSAFRTWDYRVGVQLVAQDGSIHEMITQFMGIGTRSAEHFEMKDASSEGSLMGINYTIAQNSAEHITIANAYDAALYGGCYEPGDIEAVEAWNSDDGSGDWGRYLNVSFTKEINLHQVREQESRFVIKDSEGNSFFPTTISANYTGRILVFDFMSFNNAVGDITITYTPGSVASMCDALLPAFSFTFTPKNLVPVEGLPEVSRAWNSEIDTATIEDGQCVNIQFDQALYGELSDNWSKFSVFTEQHVYSEYPEGTLVPIEVPFIDLRWHPEIDNTIQFKFGSGNASSLQKCAGRIIVEYRGGNLYGDKGPLLSFSFPFTPVGIAYRGDASDGEHFTIESVRASQELTRVYYSSYDSPGEHFTMTGASSSGTLTHISNI